MTGESPLSTILVGSVWANTLPTVLATCDGTPATLKSSPKPKGIKTLNASCNSLRLLMALWRDVLFVYSLSMVTVRLLKSTLPFKVFQSSPKGCLVSVESRKPNNWVIFQL